MELTEMIHENMDNYGPPDYDGLWKIVIDELFEEFMQYFAPDLYDEIDFTRKAMPLKQEFYNRIFKTQKGKNIVDKVMQVFLKNGEKKWVLIHIEVQAKANDDFPKRMFRYFFRIYDYFDEHDVYAIALVTDKQKTPPPNTFHYSFYGTEVDYTYNCYHFHDHPVGELEQSNNPFAYAIIAGKYANQFKNDTEKRFYFKRKLMKQILQRFSSQQQSSRIYISALFYFIDYLLRIPEDLNSDLKSELYEYLGKEGEHQMNTERGESPILAGIYEEFEKRAKEKVMKEGMEKGQQEEREIFARRLLAKGMEIDEIVELTQVDETRIIEIQRNMKNE